LFKGGQLIEVSNDWSSYTVSQITACIVQSSDACSHVSRRLLVFVLSTDVSG